MDRMRQENQTSAERLRYPIGRFNAPASIGPQDRAQWIEQIANLPAELRSTVADLEASDLDRPYREGGWTIRQVVHHLPDSHMNSYTRFRLALTEDKPVIKPYQEAKWADLQDAKTAPIDISLILLESLHTRWTILLRSMTGDQFDRAFVHPELGVVDLQQALGLYAWHGRHHVAQIAAFRNNSQWR